MAAAPAAQPGRPSGEPFVELVAIMDRLRSPGGCPWDAEQTHASLVTYLIEEAYEVVEAIESDDSDGICEELGDLLLQVVFHARIAAERETDPWNIDDVAAGIAAKIVSRHPHVFGSATAETAQQVQANWQAIKAAEKARTSALDGIPSGLPALLLAEKMIHRMTNAGVTPKPGPGAATHAAESALPAGASLADFGELLLALVVRGRDLGLDAEAALRHALRNYAERIRAAESGRSGIGQSAPAPSGD